MSRGPGRWQRAVLKLVADAPLDEHGLPEVVTVDDVAKCCAEVRRSPSCSRSVREAIRRAMRSLHEGGKLDLWTVYRGTRYVLAARRRFTPTEEVTYRGLRVERLTDHARLLARLGNTNMAKDAYDDAIAAQRDLDELLAGEMAR